MCIMINRLKIGLVVLSLGTFLVSYESVSRAQGNSMPVQGAKMKRHVVLLGASVGKAWDFPGLPARVSGGDYTCESVTEYRFNKSDELAAILSRAQDKPDAVIIKECAAFFPGDLMKYQGLIRRWADECRRASVVPIFATVVPVTRTYPFRTFVLHLLHGKFLYPRGTFEGIIAYNDWIREYAAQEKLTLIDLEAAVRISPKDRHLKESFARKDGLHLNSKAYRELDRTVIPALQRVVFFN
jgi:hypothetical protein